MPLQHVPAPWGVVSAKMRFKMFTFSSLPGGVCPEVVVYTSRDSPIEFDSVFGSIGSQSETQLEDDVNDLIFPMGLLRGPHLR